MEEKTGIPALDRKDQMLSLGQAERHAFEYKRNGTLGVFAAFKTVTSELLGRR
ncbi:hypothetical protein IAG25_31645 [Caballeronia sp. EK]|uniref:hypothetical protein n=1 Tax=Caballeronia sp. EK TaxID=2767469 RepID=UPI0016564D9E|nr:hypothetical protein [Caballeronia sp. EK]MBC8641375.1 hypothetical protein [Caballeronia sp. EK]